jgi:hypothetical protein
MLLFVSSLGCHFGVTLRVQIMAPAWREDLCLRVAEAVEAVTHRTRPPTLYSNLA